MIRIVIGFIPFCWLRAVELVVIVEVTVVSASFTSTTIREQLFANAISTG